MEITTIETETLGDRSYLISHEGVAIVIDPQRDIDRITQVLQQRDLRLALVCETHIHNDYVTGGLALARATGAEYLVNAEDDVAFERREIRGGDAVAVGELILTAIASPGHTTTHLAYVVEGPDGPRVLFTGGSMLYGTVGRTDLLGPELTESLSRSQFQSVRRMAEELPDDTVVFPTHGFGSFCASAGGAGRTSGTVADEKAENLACTTPEEDDFVATLMGGFSAYPPYYAHMGLLNRAGPLAPDLGAPSPATPEQLASRVAAGEWVVDLRARADFAAAHLAGSVSVDLDGSFATYLGWAIPWGTPLSFVADTSGQIAAAQREAVRIGLDRPLAAADGGLDAFAAGQDVATYRRATFADLAEHPDAVLVDVRRPDEWDDGHIEGATHLPMHGLTESAAELSDEVEHWVHCASGFRASIAASLIDRAGKRVVYIDDDWDNAKDGGRRLTDAVS